MPDLSRAGFSGNAFPQQVTDFIINKGLSGSPFFAALTRMDTQQAAVAFPAIDPDGFAWTPELGTIPPVNLNDTGPLVAPAKLGGQVLASNESLQDATFDISTALGNAVRDSLGPLVDDGCLYGAGGAEPVGVMTGLTVVSGPSLRVAAIMAASELWASGGTPNTLFVSPALWGTEMSRETDNGQPIYSGTEPQLAGMRIVVVPKMKPADALVLDTTRAYGVVRNDARIEFNSNSDTAWGKDATSLRVLARVAAIIPAPTSAARALSVAAPVEDAPEGE